jgi:hypothetical protein
MSMRKLFVILCAALGAAAAFGQGTVNFVNDSSEFGGDTSKLLHWADGVQPGVVLNPGLTGLPAASVGLVAGGLVTSNSFPSLRAQLYYGASTATSFSQLTAITGPPASFRSTTSANGGAWNGGNRTVDSWVGDTHQQLAVIVWDINKASDGLVALAGLAQGTYSGLYGQSALFDYRVPGFFNPPGGELMVNMSAFNVAYYDTIPEPHTFALIAFGIGILATIGTRQNRYFVDK